MLCDDSPMVRETLRRTLATIPTVTRIITSTSGEDLLSRWVQERADLVLLALGIPGIGSTRTVERLLALDANALVLLLAEPRDADLVARGLTAGAAGFLPKTVTRPELIGVLAQLAPHYSPPMISEPSAARLWDGSGQLDGFVRKRSEAGARMLSRRELEVLGRVSEGETNPQISAALGLSEDTVKTHLRRAFRKLGARDRAHAVALAYQQGILR